MVRAGVRIKTQSSRTPLQAPSSSQAVYKSILGGDPDARFIVYKWEKGGFAVTGSGRGALNPVVRETLHLAVGSEWRALPMSQGIDFQSEERLA